MISQQKNQSDFTVECKITIKGAKSIDLEYSKRFTNGKDLGHMNDYQSYENLDIKTVTNFLRNQKIQSPVFVQGCKRLATFENVKSQIVTYLQIIEGVY